MLNQGGDGVDPTIVAAFGPATRDRAGETGAFAPGGTRRTGGGGAFAGPRPEIFGA